MFEEQLKQLAKEKQKKEAYFGLSYKNLKKEVQAEMLKNGVESLGKKWVPSNTSQPKKMGMVNRYIKR